MTSARLPKPDRIAPVRDGVQGFTLIEMMVTVAIAAILLGIGVPSLSSFIRSQSVKTASFDVTSALVFARSEAIKRNADVVITPVSSDWKNGWTVTVSMNGNTSTLGRQSEYKNLSIATAASSITYRANGRIAGAVMPRFEITGDASKRCVSVSLSGLPSSKTGAC